MKPESKWDYKLSRVRTPGLLCHFLHKTTFQSSAPLQDFYASGFYFHSLISLFHYCERQCLITTEVLERYQIALQTAGAGTITASATAPLHTPLSPPAPQSQQRCMHPSCSTAQDRLQAGAAPPLLPATAVAPWGPAKHVLPHVQRHRFHHGTMQGERGSTSQDGADVCSSWTWRHHLPLLIVHHKESSECPALSQLGAKEQWGQPLPPPCSSCNLWLTHSSQSPLLAQHRNTSSTEN